MRLPMDLRTIYGDLLVKKGVKITASLAGRIRQMGQRHKQVRIPLKQTDMFADFKKIFLDKRYKTMLSPPVSKKEICGVAGALEIENDLVFEMAAMKKRLPYTYSHVLRVAAFTIKLSITYKPDEYDKEIITHCGFTHDIGKTRIPVAILNKKGKLTRSERALIRTHPAIGYLLLNYYLKSDRIDCSLASLEHHERPDGTGYPNGIRRMRKYAKLVSVVDVMDALMTSRPYRKSPYSLRSALDYLLKESRSGRFDKGLVLSLISYARKTKPDIKDITISLRHREPLPTDIFYEKYK